MGGLAGAVHLRGAPPDPVQLDRMAMRLSHRGPDGSGRFIDGPVAFAHQLRRVRPSASTQPVVGDDLVVLLDGWIYEHEKLAARAGQAGPCTDAEALLGAWRRWGVGMLEHIDGEFAIAVWERTSKTLWLIRDRIGTRPLFWTRSGDRVAFASELPALTSLPWVSRRLDADRLAEFLSFTTVHAPRTLLRDVRQVEPGTYLRIDPTTLSERVYWRPVYAPVDTQRPREGAVVEALQEAVDQAVRKRIVPSTPTGVFLSGGLGSTAIANAGISQHLQLPSFTVSMAEDPHPESPFAGRVARLLGLDHQVVTVGSSELARSFHSTVKALGHPVGHPAALLQFVLARQARAHVRVALSGDGGEEIFGGRMLDRVVTAIRRARTTRLLPSLARRAAAFALGEGPARQTESHRALVLELGIGGTDLFSVSERAALLRDHGLVRPRVRREVLEPLYAGLETDPINMALHGYLRSWLGDGSLVRADRTAAASGLDMRFPLVDRLVVERAAALPGSFKVRRIGGSLHTRWPLRAMLNGVLPPPLVNRPKRGMPKPLGPWLAGPGRLFMEDRFQHLRADRFGLWRTEALDQLRREIGSKRGAGIRMWCLFLLDAWLEDL